MEWGGRGGSRRRRRKHERTRGWRFLFQHRRIIGNQLEGRKKKRERGPRYEGGVGEWARGKREVERQVTTHAAATERDNHGAISRTMYDETGDWSPEVEVRKDSCRWLQSFA